MHSPQLSKADSRVLAQVFDPEGGPTSVEVLVDPKLPEDRHIGDGSHLLQLKASEASAIKVIETFEKSQSKTARAKDDAYREALALLDQIIVEYPEYASARNNRAQLRRWRFGDRNMLCQLRRTTNPERIAAASAAVQDLKRSISLASLEKPQDAVSPSQGRLLAQVYTQLGALYHAASKDLGSHAQEEIEVVCGDFEVWTKDDFGEEASRLFYLGGLYGNEVAKALAVHTNPHAKLCGSIVKEAMRKELAQVGA